MGCHEWAWEPCLLISGCLFFLEVFFPLYFILLGEDLASTEKSLPGEGGKYFPPEFSGADIRKWQLFGAECCVLSVKPVCLEGEWPQIRRGRRWGCRDPPRPLSFLWQISHQNEFLSSSAMGFLSSLASMLWSICIVALLIDGLRDFTWGNPFSHLNKIHSDNILLFLSASGPKHRVVMCHWLLSLLHSFIHSALIVLWVPSMNKKKSQCVPVCGLWWGSRSLGKALQSLGWAPPWHLMPGNTSTPPLWWGSAE